MLQPGDIWYIVGAGSFCGLVLIILIIVWIRVWVKSRAKSRRLQEPNPANERTLDNLHSPLMQNATMPGMAKRLSYEEKDPYAYNDQSQVQPSLTYDQSEQKPAYYYEHPNLSNPELFGQPMVPADQQNHMAVVDHQSYSQHSHNPYASPYDAPLPSSSHDHSSYEYDYNSSQDHHHPAQLAVDPQHQQPYFSPTEYATPDSYHSPGSDYHLMTPQYPDPGMRRIESPASSVSDPYTAMPSGVTSGRTSVHPAYPPPARSPVKSPRGARAELNDTPNSQKRFMERYGRHPPVPDRPHGLTHYASGMQSQEDYDGRDDYRDDYRASSSNDHSSRLHVVNDPYLYGIPSSEGPTNPYSPRRLYG
ncbi:hypothetical protein BD324DRAFT_303499 [Kockovaella imperatae]|uniref:Uncharacterized protein n=1 Tax=Kockovaella imperatae TaxID=4999 RepID=A0A1Y1ULS2_9TREE|nr:hypothetical protein BD324DRAFT_303499 [Kockovaella imperatae]ORX39000.1 hypothetical protein BD324DRAFT_303499 [Kockovaella imperatae]